MLNKILISLIVILIGIIIFFKVKSDKLNLQLSKTNDSLNISNQNNSAYLDKLKMKTDSVQNFSLLVGDLQNQKNNISNKYNILNGKFKLLVDSIKILGDGNIIKQNDSVFVANLNGYIKPYYYNGFVKYNLYVNTYVYNLSIKSDDLLINSYIYLDSNNIIKNKLITNYGKIDSAETVVDKNVYLAINKSKIYTEIKKTFLDNLQFPFYVEYNKNKELNLSGGISYEILDNTKIYIKNTLYNMNNNEISIGVYHSPSLRQIFNGGL